MTNWQTQNSKRNSRCNEETPEERISLHHILQHKDVNLRWEDKMEIEEDNFLTSYNSAEAMSNNVAIETIQEGPNHSDFKAVLEEYKDI